MYLKWDRWVGSNLLFSTLPNAHRQTREIHIYMFYCQWVKKQANKQTEWKCFCVCMWICTVHIAWIAREVFTSINTYRPQLMLNFLSLVLSVLSLAIVYIPSRHPPHRKKAFTKRFSSYDEIICTFIYVQVHMKTLKWFSRKRKKLNCICGFGERRNLSHRWEGWMNHSTQHMSHKVGAVCLFCLVTFIRWREKVSSFFLIATN